MHYVNGNGPPPTELELVWLCERWNTLPEAGPMMEQSYRQLTDMAVASNVHRVVSRTRNLVGRQIHSLTDNERRILRTIKEMGLL